MELGQTTSHRGILNPESSRRQFRLSRYSPAPDVGYFVERHWIVRWDLRGRAPYVSETLPHPCVNMVFEPSGGRVWGVPTRRFERRLEGRGFAVGTKFRPGGFHPFRPWPVAELTDGALGVDEVFGPEGARLESAVLASEDDREQVALVEAFLRGRWAPLDPAVATIARIVQGLLDAPDVARVEELAARHGYSSRTLQRLFRRYVGVGPKWVLKRYRLHEAAERMAEAPAATGRRWRSSSATSTSRTSSATSRRSSAARRPTMRRRAQPPRRRPQRERHSVPKMRSPASPRPGRM
jgi:AraC-like DNA-binding protein